MYTIYLTYEEADKISRDAAIACGCQDTTTQEFSVWLHPTDGRGALRDYSGPVSHQQMLDDGWFPSDEV